MTRTREARPFTRADLDAMPDDGYRYELIDGVLIVSPAPRWLHQRVVGRVSRLLDDACSTDLEVLFAPFDVVLADDTVVEPDVLIGRRSDFTDRDLPAPPVLAVEVLSPSTRHVDLGLKRSRFEAAGITSYWVIDPAEPSLRVWELVNGVYVDLAHVVGDEDWTAVQPYPVTVNPVRLVVDHLPDRR